MHFISCVVIVFGLEKFYKTAGMNFSEKILHFVSVTTSIQTTVTSD